MTFFGIIWLILLVICMFSKLENMIVLTIVSATIQCSNVVVWNGVGIGPQVITAIVCIIKVLLSRKGLRISIYSYKFSLILGTVVMSICVILSSALNNVIGQNYIKIAQLLVYIFCFFSMFFAGEHLRTDLTYRIIRNLTIALLIIGALQFGITSGILPRISIVKTFLYNDTTSDVIYYTRNNYYRILSTYMEPSYFAGYVVGSFYYFLSYKEKRNENTFLLACIFIEIILTFSSSAYGAFILGGLIFIASTKEKKLKLTILIGAFWGFVIMYFFFFDVLDSVIFSKATSNSAVARHYWNVSAIERFYTSPLFGIGYKMSRGSSIIYTVLSELGILGMIAYIFMNVIVFIPILQRKKKIASENKGLRLAVISVVLTQIIAVPDLDICTYWMWMNLLALYIAFDRKKVGRKS